MKKARHVLGLLLAIVLSLSILPSNLVRADSLNTNDKVLKLSMNIYKEFMILKKV